MRDKTLQEYVFMLCIFYLVFSWYRLLFYHKPYTDKDYINAIVGESSDQSQDTMVCVAHALRNRGTLRGVYGYHAKHNAHEPRKIWAQAAVAWDLSKYEKDNVKGAKNWGTEEDIEESDNPEAPIKAVCGDLYFY